MFGKRCWPVSPGLYDHNTYCDLKDLNFSVTSITVVYKSKESYLLCKLHALLSLFDMGFFEPSVMGEGGQLVLRAPIITLLLLLR